MSASSTVEITDSFTMAGKAIAVGFDAALLVWVVLAMGLSLLPLFIVACVALVIQAPIWRAKEVFADEAGLRVRGLRSETLIPYDQIEELRKSSRVGFVHVLLRSDTPFGRDILFRPRWGFTRPAIDLLRSRMLGR